MTGDDVADVIVFAATRPPRHLRHQLKGPLLRPEVRQRQRRVRAEHAHQRHPGKVQPLGDHLRAQQHPQFPLPEPPQHIEVVRRPLHRVRVHPLEPLRAAPPQEEVRRRRFGADPAIIGSTTELDGVAHEVVGVMPDGFVFPRGEDVPAGFRFDIEASGLAPETDVLDTIRRLRPVALEVVRPFLAQELTRVTEQALAEMGADLDRGEPEAS